MNKIKEFIKNKKIVILIVIIVLLLLAVGLFFIFQSGASTDNKTNSQTIENTETSTTSSKNIEGNEESKEEAKEDTSDNTSAETADSSKGSDQTTSSNISNSKADPPPSGNSGNGYGSSQTVQSLQPAQPVHTHSWKDHTAQRWVSNIVTVVDEPEQTVKYSIYRMYWYTTGTWEETRDHARFDTWYKSKDGGLYPLYHPYEKPEDNPLFKGYDDNGNPTYTGDHAIIGPYYETKPAVTHEEDHGYYESYVDYQYCDCGATR